MENVTKREKAIKGLECCGDQMKCDDCPYDPDIGQCFSRMKADALELLKLQEPKPVKITKNAYNYEFYYCPNCDRSFYDTYYKRPLFCDKCGQAVKWDE